MIANKNWTVIDSPIPSEGVRGFMSYAVKESYCTPQGEDADAGRSAVFCRFSGCNLWSGQEGRGTCVMKFFFPDSHDLVDPNFDLRRRTSSPQICSPCVTNAASSLGIHAPAFATRGQPGASHQIPANWVQQHADRRSRSPARTRPGQSG